MKVMVFCFIILAAGIAKSDEEAEFQSPIQQGRWNLGINEIGAYNTSDGMSLRTTLEAQYFLVEGLSLGITGSHEQSSRSNERSLGLIGTYYFAKFENSAFYISQSIMWSEYEVPRWNFRPDEYIRLRTTLGYNYFLTPNIAIGPRIEYDWNKQTQYGQRGNLGLGVGISVSF